MENEMNDLRAIIEKMGELFKSDKIELPHPCRDTCSGWHQGYKSGQMYQHQQNEKVRLALLVAVEALYFYSVEMNSGFKERFPHHKAHHKTAPNALEQIKKILGLTQNGNENT
jgi:hypothetical protein